MNYFYNTICALYSLFCSAIEIFLKNKVSNKSKLIKNGYLSMRLKDHSIEKIGFAQKKKVNKYMEKFLLSKSQIKKIINLIFIKNNIAKKISSMTGLNYSVDYIISYRTHPIKKKDLQKGWYANHWHYDKPFSKNTLKIILPIKKINKRSHGGIECLNKKNSNFFFKNKFISREKGDYQMISDTNKLLIIYPNLCLHRAGRIKEKNYQRDQIMIQLNPSRNWQVNKNIKNKQLLSEPKFPFFSYFFDRQINLSSFLKI